MDASRQSAKEACRLGCLHVVALATTRCSKVIDYFWTGHYERPLSGTVTASRSLNLVSPMSPIETTGLAFLRVWWFYAGSTLTDGDSMIRSIVLLSQIGRMKCIVPSPILAYTHALSYASAFSLFLSSSTARHLCLRPFITSPLTLILPSSSSRRH